MTLVHVIEKMARTRNLTIRAFFAEAYKRYYAADIPEDELVADCKAFDATWHVPEYVEDYIASIYGLL